LDVSWLQVSKRDVEKFMKTIEVSTQLSYLNLSSLPMSEGSFTSLLLLISKSKRLIHLDLT